MARYPIKMLKDEEGNPFVPLVSTEGVQSPDQRTLAELLGDKLEADNIIPGENVTITTDGNDITISTSGKGVLIDDLNTATAGLGGLDAHQGKVLKEMIPNIVDDVTSTSTTEALSANQGYVLNQKVVPAGGKAGQVLKKKSDSNHSLEWGDAADPNAIVGDGSIKKIIEITYEDYKILEDNGQVDPNTEYHILDAAQTIQNLQDILDGLQEQINKVKEQYLPLTGGTLLGNVNLNGNKLTTNYGDLIASNDKSVSINANGGSIFLRPNQDGSNEASLNQDGTFNSQNIKGDGEIWSALHVGKGQEYKRLQIDHDGTVSLYESSNAGQNWSQYPLLQKRDRPLDKILVSSQVILPSFSTSDLGMTIIRGSTLMHFWNFTNGIDIPDGWHIEYRLTGLINTTNANVGEIYLNNTKLLQGGTWDGHCTLFATTGSIFFTKEDIGQEAIKNYQHLGVNIKLNNTESGYVVVENITIHAYLVKD